MRSLNAAPTNLISRTGRLIRLGSRFIRFAALGATVSIALIGAVTAEKDLAAGTALGIAGVAVAHHLFSFIFNDVIDLPIDRTEPRRAESPLVNGLIPRSFALWFSLAGVPLAFWLSALIGAGLFEQTLLAVSLLLVAVYDLWGKKTTMPPAMDFIQGVGWAFLGWYGAEMAGGSTWLTLLLGSFFTVYILMTNGIHGGLRDLANDLSHGASTTPRWLGATPVPGGGARFPRTLVRYAVGLQIANTLITGSMVLAVDYESWTVVYAVAAWLLLSAVSFQTLLRGLNSAHDRETMMVQGTLHLIYSFGVVLAVLAPAMPPYLLVMAVVVYVTPLLTYGWLIDAVRGVPQPRSAR